MGLFANLETLELARLFSRSKGVLEAATSAALSPGCGPTI